MQKPAQMTYATRKDITKIAGIKHTTIKSRKLLKYYERLFDDSKIFCHLMTDGSGYLIKRVHNTFIEIVDMSVKHDSLRKGHGTSLINKIKSCCMSNKHDSIVCNVPEDNIVMQLFLRSCGFSAVRILKRKATYYQFLFVSR